MCYLIKASRHATKIATQIRYVIMIFHQKKKKKEKKKQKKKKTWGIVEVEV